MSEVPPSTGPKPPALPASMLAAEARSLEYLRRQEWRKARDEIKPLIRSARERFVPLLVEANLGLAREMHARGQAGGVKQTLDYLATLLPPEALEKLRQEFSRPPQAKSPDPATLRQSLFAPDSPLDEAARTAIVDALVLRFEGTDADPAVPPAFTEDLARVHRAIGALCANQPGEAEETVRPISHRSLLRHWALFVRGLAAFHAGEDDRALRLLGGLPTGGLTARAAECYLFLLAPEGQPVPHLSEPTRRALGVLVREPEIARAIQPAHEKWTSGNHFDSYRWLRDKIPGFPSRKPGWSGALSDFYFRAYAPLTGKAQDAYLGGLGSLLDERAFHGPVEEMELLRLLAFEDARFGPPDLLEQEWLRYLRLRSDLLGPNPRLEAIACQWLADILAKDKQETDTDFYSFLLARSRKPSIRGEPSALRLYQRAIQACPDHLPSHLGLVALHRKAGRDSERNRLLDDLTRRFPDSAAVLVEAGLGCVERAAFVKGLEYLRRARQLDAIDPRIAHHLIDTSVQLARQYHGKGKTDRARRCFADLEDLLVPSYTDLTAGHWIVDVQRRALERVHLDPAERRAAPPPTVPPPFPAADLFALELFARKFDRIEGRNPSLSPELLAALRTPLSFTDATYLLLLLKHVTPQLKSPADFAMADAIDPTMARLAKLPCSRDEAVNLLEAAGPKYAKTLSGLLRRMLAAHPTDPRFRWYHLENDLARPGRELRNSDLDEARSILAEATRRQDRELIGRARETMLSIEYDLAPVRRRTHPDAEITESLADATDDSDDPDPSDDPEFDPSRPMFAGGPSGPEFLLSLARATPPELDRLRAACKTDAERAVWENLVRLAQAQYPPENRSTPPPVLSQGELFPE